MKDKQEIIAQLETLMNKHQSLNEFKITELLAIRNIIRDNKLQEFGKVLEMVQQHIETRFTQFEMAYKSGVL
ncbi:hypothetical protein P0J00_003452 [Vibrio vulnificus]|nr:hypothetical protein [Vibrio vulnificus]EKO5193463.1 hypothetical protein [Vibrio vulnificus]